MTETTQPVVEQANNKMAQSAALNFIATVRHGGVVTMMFGIEHLVVTAICSLIEAGGANTGLEIWSQLIARCDERINQAVLAKKAKPNIVLN